jgi:hypothetical protein
MLAAVFALWAVQKPTTAAPTQISMPRPVVHHHLHRTVAAGEDPKDFDAGLADHNGWERWLHSLTGDARDGAEYWAAHRRDQPRPTCTNLSPAKSDIWTAACFEAQGRLARSDMLRKNRPNYRKGWNSYMAPLLQPAPQASSNSDGNYLVSTREGRKPTQLLFQ